MITRTADVAQIPTLREPVVLVTWCRPISIVAGKKCAARDHHYPARDALAWHNQNVFLG